MDWLTTIPLIVGAVAKLSALVLQTIAQRLQIAVLAMLIIGGVGLFAMTAFAWLWVKRTLAGLHPPPSLASR